MKSFISRQLTRRVLPLAAIGFLSVAACALGADDRPQPEPQQVRIAELIERLGSEEYSARRRAEDELLRLGFEAFDALKAAEQHANLEIASRASYLARRITVEWIRPDDPARVKAILNRYAELAEQQRLGKIGDLAALGADEGLRALCRIVRFEKSQVLSKRAALEIVGPKPVTENRTTRRLRVIQEAIGPSKRPAARWLLTYAQSLGEPGDVSQQWAEHAAEEQRELETFSDQSESQVLAKLLYTSAQAYAAEGFEELAEETAERASELSEGNASDHYFCGAYLQMRGLYAWAQREYRKVSDLGESGGSAAIAASRQLAAMLHDLGDDQAAAEVLRPIVEAADQSDPEPKQPQRPSDWSSRGVRQALHQSNWNSRGAKARMEFFLAMHHGQQQDWARQKEHLNQAVANDPLDADVLIAMYRFKQSDAAYREKALKHVRKAVKQFEQQIGQDPGDATLYNQWAWLVANTEGDFQKAIEYSHRSLKMNPGRASLLDTLAHCYFAAGDFSNAVKYQEQAFEEDPYTKAIEQQLDVFKAALAESKQSQP